MSQLTKQQLKGENQSQFPNNNVGAITPSHLRAFNVDMIDSTVNQTDFTNFSGSVAGEIDALESFSSSLDTNFASQAEFNSYTQSNDNRVTSLINATASYANSASVAAVDSAQQSQIDSLIAATASYVTETESGSFLITASFDNGTRNLTFTKGDTTTFAVNIPDVSGSAGNFVTTSSFNAYTSSNDQRVSSLEAVTSSFATTGSNTFTGNQIINANLYVSSSNTSDVVVNGQVFISSSATGGTTAPKLTGIRTSGG